MKTLKRIYFTVVLNWQFLIAVIFASVIRVYSLMQELNILILKFMFVIVALWFLRQQRQQEQRSDCELYVVC